jgi:perosamine synthetase
MPRNVRLASNPALPEDFDLIEKVFWSGWFSPGPMVERFEKEFAKAHDSKYAVMVNSGTDALRIALLALKERKGWKDGSEVIVPALTFVASVNTILQAGLAPKFVDVYNKDLTINIDLLRDAITPETVAVMPVHLFGKMCGMIQIQQFCKEKGLAIVEDSCEAMGVRTICNWGTETGVDRASLERSVGSFGDFGCFSTYACHIINTGVGGMLITSDETLYKLARSWANHGRDPEFLGGYSAKDKDPRDVLAKRFLFYREGYSCRPTEFEAALGISQLERLPQIIQQRKAIALKLNEALLHLYNELELPYPHDINTQRAWMMYPVILKNIAVDREAFCLSLEDDGIETRFLMPLLTQPVYNTRFNAEDYPVALRASKRGFYIPCHPDMTDDDITHIKDSFERAILKTREPVHV